MDWGAIKGLGASVQEWSPRMSFILKGSQISTLQLKGWFKSKKSIQEYRNEIPKLILSLCMNYMIHVSGTMWRIKNQPSRANSCSDSALRLSGSCGGQIISSTSSDVFILQFGVAFWRVVLREVYFEGPNRVWRALKTSIWNIAWDERVRK